MIKHFTHFLKTGFKYMKRYLTSLRMGAMKIKPYIDISFSLLRLEQSKTLLIHTL
jgi:hypothetical protein